MSHVLDDARGQMREGHTSSQWELIAREKVMRTLLDTGEFTADSLAELNIPVEYRRHVHGAATGYFSGAQPFMEEAGRRKSDRPSRKGGKNTVFVINARGRRELPRLLRDLQRELSKLVGLSSGPSGGIVTAAQSGEEQEIVGSTTAAEGMVAHPRDGRSGGPGEPTPEPAHPEAKSVASPPPAVEATAGSGSSARPDSSARIERRGPNAEVAGSNPARDSQEQCGATRRSTNERTGYEDNPITGGIARRPARTETQGDKSEVPAAASDTDDQLLETLCEEFDAEVVDEPPEPVDSGPATLFGSAPSAPSAPSAYNVIEGRAA